MKNVQIPEDLFFDLCKFHLTGAEMDELDTELLLQDIQRGLQTKLEAMERRAAYTAYKDTRASPEARERARQAYLDMVGMLPGYRWSSLDPPV